MAAYNIGGKGMLQRLASTHGYIRMLMFFLNLLTNLYNIIMSKKKHRLPKTLNGCLYVYFSYMDNYIKNKSGTMRDKINTMVEAINSLYQKQFNK